MAGMSLGSPEWEALRDEVVQHHAHAPHVSLDTVLPSEDFRCHIHRGPSPMHAILIQYYRQNYSPLCAYEVTNSPNPKQHLLLFPSEACQTAANM